MAQREHLQITLRVVAARDLPKTDRFSSIDAYIVVTTPDPEVKFLSSEHKTKTIDNSTNPVWEEEFILIIPFDPATLALPEFKFELWDKNSISKDQQVGLTTVKLNPDHFRNRTKIHDFPIELFDAKHAKHHTSILNIQFSEYAYTAESLYRLAKPHIPGIVYIPHGLGRLYVPLSIGPVVLALEYEKKCVDVKLYSTDPQSENYIDVVQVGKADSRVRRRKTKDAVIIGDNFRTYEEVKLNDVPFHEVGEPGKVLFFVFKKTKESETNLSEVVSAHGWSGSMNFEEAAKKLKNVEINKAEEEIWMKQGDTFIVVDFDKDNVDMKCMVLDVPENNNYAYDFTLDGPDAKKTTDIFSPPKRMLGGKYPIQRKLELDDVAYGTYFTQMHWFKYKLSNPVQVAVNDVIKLHPF